MTTGRKEVRSSRGDKPSDLDSYNKASMKAATGKLMRTFSRSKRSGIITTWNDIDFLVVLDQYFYPLADVSGAVDGSTTISAQMESLLDVAWEAFYSNANLKDLVVAEEASWKLYFAASFFIASCIQIQYNFRCYLPAYTENDAVPGSNTNIAYFSQSSFDIFVASMKEYPIPKGVFELVDVFCTTIIKVFDEYERYTLRNPPMYILPFDCRYDLEDLEAARGLLRVNLGGFTTHAKKFGLKIGAWRDPVKPTEKSVNDPDVIALFCHMKFSFYNDAPAVEEVFPNGGFKGANLVADYNDHEYYFKDDPNESIIHLLAPWFGLYNGTNNPYGGFILTGDPATTLYDLNMKRVAENGNNIAAFGMTEPVAKVVMSFIKCAYDNNTTGYHHGIFGDNITVERGDDDMWPLMLANKLWVGGVSRGATETNNDILNYIGRLLV